MKSQTIRLQIHPNSKVPPLLQLDILKGIVPPSPVVLNLISHGGPSSLWRENIRGRDVHHTPACDPNETNSRDDLEQQASCREPWGETLMFFYVIQIHPGKCRNFTQIILAKIINATWRHG